MNSKSAMRFLSTCGLCALLMGCGTDVVRMSETPVPNPFSGSARFEPPITGSLSNKTQPIVGGGSDVLAAPAVASGNTAISSVPLDAPSGSQALVSEPAPNTNASKTAPQAQAASSYKTALNTPESAPVTVPLNAKSVSASSGAGKWVAEGGSEVTLGNGETIAILSARYGVPENAIRGANGLTAMAKPPRGAKLIIPVYVADGSLTPTKTKPQPAAKTASLVPVTPPPVEPTASKQPVKKSAPVAEAATPAQVASLENSAPANTGLTPALADTAKGAVAAGFRWPARGRVIQGFGDKNGVKSTGINISLPQGTPIKAAEAGVVAYAGSEVKGFGNLVMIRHSDGWVSVYGNNSEIKVKRGDDIKRGQVIALSGQSGDVSAPQLHFELRKGSVPVDPVEHLSDD